MKTLPLFLCACLLPLFVFADDVEDINGAADSGDLAKVTAFLDKGVSVDFQDEKYKETPLMHASVRDHPEVVKFLLSKGAKPNLVNVEGRTALFWGAWCYDMDIIKMLLDAGADPNIADKHGDTPFGFISSSDPDDVETFLKAKANPNLLNSHDQTPLMRAAWQDEATTVEILLKYGANIDMENKAGETALMKAQQKGYADAAKVLRAHGAKEKPLVLNPSPYETETFKPDKAWAIAVPAIIVQANGDSHEMLGFRYEHSAGYKDYMRGLLVPDHGVTNKKTLEARLKYLLEEGDRVKLRQADQAAKGKTTAATDKADATAGAESTRFLSWDLCRYIWLVRGAYGMKYISRAEAWELIMPVAKRLQKSFKSWDEMGADYLDARAIYRKERDPRYDRIYKMLINSKDANSPWTKNPWNTPLDPQDAPAEN